MNEYYKEGHERLSEIVKLHHYAITHIISLMKKNEENESEFRNSIKKHLGEVK
jgi:hypothetical protein